MSRRKAKRRLGEIIRATKGDTVVLALPSAFELHLFDRVLLMEKGRVVFDGTPGEWRERKASGKETEVATCKH